MGNFRVILLFLCSIVSAGLFANSCPEFASIYDQNNHIWIDSFAGWRLNGIDTNRENDLSGFKKVVLSKLKATGQYAANCYYDPMISDHDADTRIYTKKIVADQGIGLQGNYWSEVENQKICQPPIDHAAELSCQWDIIQ